MLTQLFCHRKYIFENALSSFRYRYAGTVLGVLWNVLNPLLTTVIYVIVFQQILGYRNPDSRQGFALFLIAGLFPWLAFSSLITTGSKALLRNANVLRVIKIPTVVFVAIEFLVSYIELNIYFVLMLIIYPLFGINPGWTWLFLPVGAFLLLMLGFFLTVVIANLQVLFEDVSEFTHHIIHLWRWTMPIMYTLDIFPQAFHFWMRINPPYAFIDSLRNIILENQMPLARDWLLIVFWLVVFGFIGSFINRKLEPEIRDYL